MNKHQEQWNSIESAWNSQRLPQSLLFVGPLHCDVADFVFKMMQLFSCKANTDKPCLQCNDCKMVERMEHPDVEWVKPDKNGGAIKIDQIRELQHSAYLTPQRSNSRLIVIDSADRMNTAAANALLKILEEPASHTVFILIAQQLSTILPTVLSRCQILRFSSTDDFATDNLLTLGQCYSEGSERALIITQAAFILDGIIALLERRKHPCAVAGEWSQFELSTVLWFLYLVYSQLQYMYCTKVVVHTEPAVMQLNRLYELSNSVSIFYQIDKINSMLKKLSHNMNINHTLALEDLLISLTTSN